ncbi:hypothetical protein AAG570_006158 [Ranatra chinensis]|uniref:Uncharacterized protein n=1 Tax=Ranatra chinensis TaxID=642074 RepID=A0ABD0XX75_9HEMI
MASKRRNMFLTRTRSRRRRKSGRGEAEEAEEAEEGGEEGRGEEERVGEWAEWWGNASKASGPADTDGFSVLGPNTRRSRLLCDYPHFNPVDYPRRRLRKTRGGHQKSSTINVRCALQTQFQQVNKVS